MDSDSEAENAMAHSIVRLEQKGNVFLLTMNAPPDNRFNPETVKAIHEALDRVEEYALGSVERVFDPGNQSKQKTQAAKPCALVTCSALPRFFSNGLDLMYLATSGDKWFICDAFLGLLSRVLLFPVITVSAVSGHAFAGGLLFALAHDYRVLSSGDSKKTESGTAPRAPMLSLNEIDLPSSLHPGMAALTRAKLPASTLHPLVFAARRFAGQDALKASIVDQVVPADKVMETALRLAGMEAGRVARAGRIVSHLKYTCYSNVVDALRLRTPIDVREFMRLAKQSKSPADSNQSLARL